MLWWLLVWVIAFGLLLALDGRRRARRVLRDWELVLTPKGERVLDLARTRVQGKLALMEFTYSQARRAQDVGRTREAMRLLDEGCHLIEQYCPSMMRSLAALAVLSRMASAVAPVQPLDFRAFRLRQIEGIALLNQFVHHLLVTTGERFRLRVYFLARAFATLLRVVTGATQRVKQTRPAEPEWRQLEAACHDVHSLSDEWLESFRVLLMSLAAERR